ncbi:MAG: L-histidine N(alpha)-methyltransferase [Candidatus Acidiferrales bacterium]
MQTAATSAAAARDLSEFCSDVVTGLNGPGQKELPSKYLYDSVGSALFDAISLLPEYGLSRAGMRLLQRHASEIVERLPGPVVVAELGSGNGQKTRHLLEALARRQRVNYFPIDISGSALFRCRQELGNLEMVSLVGFESAYLDGLHKVAARRRDGERLLVLFLGSTIGNFDRSAGEQFLRDVRSILQEGDSLLLATDLEKPISMLKLAYDDPPGVTAAFNKNLLARINRELDGEFDLNQFEHVVRYDESEHRIEMHLRSKIWQNVAIRKAGFRFHLREGETIWTESSHKYDARGAREIGGRAGFECVEQWIDAEWPFAQNLFFAV